MKRNLVILMIFFSTGLLYGQNAKRDSIRNLLVAEKNDSVKLSIIERCLWTTTWSDPEYALELAKQQLLLARKAGVNETEARALASYATVLSVLGDYSHAIDYYLQSIKLTEQLKLTTLLQLNYLNISETYCDAGDYVNSIAYAFKGKSIIDTVSRNDSATFFFKMLTWTYIGEIYEKFDKADSALFYLRKARAIDSSYFGSNSGFTTLYLAGSYAKNNQPADAIKYYRETINISKIHGYKNDLMDACNGLATVFNKTGKTDSAIFYVNETVLIGKSTSYPLATLNAVTLLSAIYRSNNNLDSTVKYLSLSILIKDSLFNREKIRQVQDISFNEQMHQQELQQKIKQNELQYRNNLNVYIFSAALIIIFLAAMGLWRRNIYKQKSYALLQKQKHEIDIQKAKTEETLSDLRSTQAQLIQSEKMASLGELTAGIAHEIQNPLNFVNNFSEVNGELISELVDEVDKGNTGEVKAIAADIKANEQKINHHGKRADAIVKGMLQHSRLSAGQKEPTDINALCDEYLKLSYHGMRASDKDFNATIKTDFDPELSSIEGKINIVPQDIGRVLLNLYNNAFYAVSEMSKNPEGFQNPRGFTQLEAHSSQLEANNARYVPTVTVVTKKSDDEILISVKDNGPGIPPNIVDKIFQPFFTTKPTGDGTGLGLSLSYDIIKAHGGEISAGSGGKVQTKESTGLTADLSDEGKARSEAEPEAGSEFIILLPVS